MAHVRADSVIYYVMGWVLATTGGIAALPCQGCPDGSSTTVPDKIITVPGGALVASCRDLEILVPIWIPDEASEDCIFLHKFSTLCGCPKRQDACHLCPEWASITNKDLVLPAFGLIAKDSFFTCELLEAYLFSMADSDAFCTLARLNASESCGCPLSSQMYPNTTDTGYLTTLGNSGSPFTDKSAWTPFFGTTSFSGMRRLFTVVQVSAGLSSFGSIIVIQDTVRSAQKRRRLYNQITTAMASFDIIFCIALSLLEIARPTDDFIDTPGERGNDATCKAQGWFLQWGGLTSLFFNAALSTYYVLVIVYQTRETRLCQLQRWILGVPIFLGLVFAFASLPFITTASHLGCHLTPPGSLPEFVRVDNLSTSWGPFLGLYVVPGFAVLLYSTAALVWVCWHIRQLDIQSKSMQSGDAQQVVSHAEMGRAYLERPKRIKLLTEVMIQSAMYLLALYIVWFVTAIGAVNLKNIIMSHYKLWVFIYFVIPLQGFMNSIAYFRPRCLKMWIQYRRKRQQTRRQQMSQSDLVLCQDIHFSESEVEYENEPEASLVELNEGSIMDAAGNLTTFSRTDTKNDRSAPSTSIDMDGQDAENCLQTEGVEDDIGEIRIGCCKLQEQASG